MSAFVCDPHHFNVLVSWAARRKGIAGREVQYYFNRAWHKIGENATRVASVLYAQNVRSVNYRYDENDPTDGYTFKRARTAQYGPADIVRACDCLDYQCCETKDWKETEAYAILQSIREAAIEELISESKVWELKGHA